MTSLSLAPATLTKLRKLCLAQPDAEEKTAWGDPTWRVNDKIFAMQKGNYQGGRPSLWFKAVDGAQSTLVASDAETFFVPPYVGGKGWVGAYLDVPINWAMLAALIAESHQLITAKRKPPRKNTRKKVERKN